MRELEKERATPLMQCVWGKGGNKNGTVWDGVEESEKCLYLKTWKASNTGHKLLTSSG